MKKLLAIMLSCLMVFSLAACGGELTLEEAAKEIEKITGDAMTVDEVQDAIDELAETTGKEVTPRDLVDMTKELSELGKNDKKDTKWPTKGHGATIPAPEWGFEVIQDSDYSFIAKFDSDKTREELQPYIDALEEAGYNMLDERGEGSYWYMQMKKDTLILQLEDGRVLIENKG